MNQTKIILCLVFSWSFFWASAQKISKVEILNAQSLKFDAQRADAQILKGNVRLKHKDAILYCDSAYFFGKQNKVDAFGNVRIVQPGKVNVWSDILKYDGNSNQAILKENVKLSDGESVIETNRLDYNTQSKVAYYSNGAKIRNETAILTSERGTYDTESEIFWFRKDVEIIDPEFTLNADTLQYNTQIDKTFFYGPTNITTKENRIYCESGWFNTETNTSNLIQNAYLINNEAQILEADTLFYDEQAQYGIAKKSVIFSDTSEKIILRSNYAFYNKKEKKIKIHNKPILINYQDRDTLFITADTLIRIATDTSEQLLAFHKVKGEKGNLALLCDSMVYFKEDSLFDFYTDPIIWLEEYQISAEFMKLFTLGDAFEKLEMYRNGLMVKKNDSIRFDQTKGKNMVAFFKEKEIHQIDVKGNAKSINHVEKEKGTFGDINQIESSDIKLALDSGELVGVTFYKQPNGKIQPFHKVNLPSLKLENFFWADTSKNQIFETIKKLKKPTKESILNTLPSLFPTDSLEQIYIHISHTRLNNSKEEKIVPDARNIDFKRFDMIWLGGDLTENSTKKPETLNYLDSIFDLKSEKTLWTLGNHDYYSPKNVSKKTQRKSFYTYHQKGITFLILDTQDSVSNIVGEQLDLLKKVCDSISKSSHLVLLHHQLIWMRDNPKLEKETNKIANGGLGNCSYCINPNNFYSEIYPLLKSVKARGIEVLCLAGDIGIKAKEFEYTTEDGIQFMASGLTESDINNKVLIFRHQPQNKTLTWSFEPLWKIN